MKRTNKWAVTLALPLLLMTAGASALAQEAPPTVGGLQEIV